MKRFWREGFIFSFLIFSFTFFGIKAISETPRPRFERLLTENYDGDLGKSRIMSIEVWHDKESGQEFTCVFPSSTMSSADKVSCFSTGRNWK